MYGLKSLQSIAMISLFFAQCTACPSPRLHCLPITKTALPTHTKTTLPTHHQDCTAYPSPRLHCLPVTKRIHYKLSSLCFPVINDTGPEHLSELLTTYTPSLQLRSASDTRLFRIHSCQTKANGQRSFFHVTPLLSGTISLKLSDIPDLSPH